MKNVKVILWGLGAMGGGIAKMLTRKTGVDIVGAIDIGDKLGRSLYEVVPGIERGGREDVIVNTPEAVIRPGAADIVVVCTNSFTREVYDKLVFVMERGMNVITSAEEMSYPQAQEPELSEKLDECAKKNGVSALGTGINPGLIMDLMAILWTAACEEVHHITCRRVNSLSPFGPAVMEEQGIGITAGEFDRKKAEGTMTGHVGFAESTMMICDALGWKWSKEGFGQDMESIVTDIDRKSPYGFAAAGNVAGVAMKGWVDIDGVRRIDMDHPQQIEPEQVGIHTGDYVIMDSVPPVNMANSPEIEGGIGTMAMIMNCIPHCINAAPGLITMLDIPVPHAIMGDFRDRIKEEKKLVK